MTVVDVLLATFCFTHRSLYENRMLTNSSLSRLIKLDAYKMSSLKVTDTMMPIVPLAICDEEEERPVLAATRQRVSVYHSSHCMPFDCPFLLDRISVIVHLSLGDDLEC